MSGRRPGTGGGGGSSASFSTRALRYIKTNRSTIGLACAFAAVIIASIIYMPSIVRPISVQNAILNKQKGNNMDTAASWRSFASHRGNVTLRLINQINFAAMSLAVERRAPRILVLGAGNVNDIDLRRVLSHKSAPHIHLVDLDINALTAGVDRQFSNTLTDETPDFPPVAGLPPVLPRLNATTDRSRVTLQRADLTGVLELVKSWPVLPPTPAKGGRPRRSKRDSDAKAVPASQAQIKEVIELIERRPAIVLTTNASYSHTETEASQRSAPSIEPIPGVAAAEAPADELFDIVISTCVMSQLISGLFDGLTAETPHETSMRLVMGIRSHHIAVMNHHLAAGGSALLVTDMVSSLTAPTLLQLRADQLADTMRHLVDTENFFHGTNPQRILYDLQVTHGAHVLATTVQIVRPWLWHFNDVVPPRSYLVYGVGWRSLPPGSTNTELARVESEVQEEVEQHEADEPRIARLDKLAAAKAAAAEEEDAADQFRSRDSL